MANLANIKTIEGSVAEDASCTKVVFGAEGGLYEAIWELSLGSVSDQLSMAGFEFDARAGAAQTGKQLVNFTKSALRASGDLSARSDGTKPSVH